MSENSYSVEMAGRVPLIPRPVVTIPFKRIVMDIVGPLENSSYGYQYILLICDYQIS